jgi:hypothetical protein
MHTPTELREPYSMAELARRMPAKADADKYADPTPSNASEPSSKVPTVILPHKGHTTTKLLIRVHHSTMWHTSLTLGHNRPIQTDIHHQ